MSGIKKSNFIVGNKKEFVSKKINQSLAKLKNNQSKVAGGEISSNQNQIDNYFTHLKCSTPATREIPNENQKNEIAIENTVENQNQVNANNEESVDESVTVNILQKEIKVLTKNFNAAKSLLRKTSRVNMEKDLHIKKLTTESEAKKKSDHLFDEFSLKFDKCQLSAIRSVGPGQKNDSRFILNIMRFLYKEDEVAKLKNRSVRGRKYKGENKHEISFEKKSKLETMFKQRVDDELPELAHSSVTNEHSKRIKNFGTLLRSAIHNILKAVQKEECRERARVDDVDDFPSSKHGRTNEGIKPNISL